MQKIKAKNEREESRLCRACIGSKSLERWLIIQKSNSTKGDKWRLVEMCQRFGGLMVVI